MLTKAQQCGRYGRRKLRKTRESEDELQARVNEYLDRCGVEYVHVPRTRNVNAILGALRGVPDNKCTIPITDKYSLCLDLELKTKSELHGEQIRQARDNPWQIAQTIEEAMEVINQFRTDADRIRRQLSDAQG